jgi:hypothetical protein
MKPQSALRKPDGKHARFLAGLSALLVVLATAGDRSAAVEAAGTTDFRATYAITLAGTVIGRASAESRFSDGSYVATIKGSTSGVSRMVTDATAALSGSGQINGKRILPASFELDTLENGFGTRVRMAMKAGRVTDVVAEPSLSKAPDRIPITPRHKTDVVDPLGAFLVPVDRPGRQACDRVVKVFDGWTRFDVDLYFKSMKAVDGGSDTYAGQVVVCGARVIPVAGHRLGGGSISDMVDSARSEIWLVPVGDTGLMVPYRIVLGTRWGDLIVYATRFTATATDQRAALQ